MEPSTIVTANPSTTTELSTTNGSFLPHLKKTPEMSKARDITVVINQYLGSPSNKCLNPLASTKRFSRASVVMTTRNQAAAVSPWKEASNKKRSSVD